MQRGFQPVFAWARARRVFLVATALAALVRSDTLIVRGANQDVYQSSSIVISGSVNLATRWPCRPSRSFQRSGTLRGNVFLPHHSYDVNGLQARSQRLPPVALRVAARRASSLHSVAASITSLCRGVTSNTSHALSDRLSNSPGPVLPTTWRAVISRQRAQVANGAPRSGRGGLSATNYRVIEVARRLPSMDFTANRRKRFR